MHKHSATSATSNSWVQTHELIAMKQISHIQHAGWMWCSLPLLHLPQLQQQQQQQLTSSSFLEYKNSAGPRTGGLRSTCLHSFNQRQNRDKIF